MAKAKTKTMLRKLKKKKTPSRSHLTTAFMANLDKEKIDTLVSEYLASGSLDEILDKTLGAVLESKEMQNHLQKLVRESLMERAEDIVEDFTSTVSLYN